MEFLQTIFGYITPLIALALGAWFVIHEYRRKKQGIVDAQEADGEEALAWQRFKAILNVCLFGLVTDAQREYGGDNGTGEVKLSSVLLKVMEMIPDNLKGRIKLDVLINYIEDALAAAKPKWADEPAILEPDSLDVTVEELNPLRVVALSDLKAGQVVELQGGVAILLDTEDVPGGPDDADPLGIAEENLRHECTRRGLCCKIEIGTPCGPDAVGELGEPGVPDDLCPVGHHWEPDGNGGFVAVLDAPADEAEEPAAPAEEAPAEEAPPRRKKRVTGTVEPVAAPAAAEEPADEEAASE